MNPAAGAIPGPDPRSPLGTWMSHRRDAAIEDIRFLTANGTPLDLALERVGVSQSAWESWHVDLNPTVVHPIHNQVNRGRKSDGRTAA